MTKLAVLQLTKTLSGKATTFVPVVISANKIVVDNNGGRFELLSSQHLGSQLLLDFEKIE